MKKKMFSGCNFLSKYKFLLFDLSFPSPAKIYIRIPAPGLHINMADCI